MAEPKEEKVQLRKGFRGRRSLMDYQQCRTVADAVTGEENGATHSDVLNLCLLSPDKLRLREPSGVKHEQAFRDLTPPAPGAYNPGRA